jgi:hypothetical protein
MLSVFAAAESPLPVKRTFEQISDKSTFSAPTTAQVAIVPAEPSDVVWRMLEQIDDAVDPDQFNARQLAAHAYRMAAILMEHKPKKRRRRLVPLAPASIGATATELGENSACAKLLDFVGQYSGAVTADFFFQQRSPPLKGALCCPRAPVHLRGLCAHHYAEFARLQQLASKECKRCT